MGIFTDQKPTAAKPKAPTTSELVSAVRDAMSDELGFTLNSDQAVERLCNIYLKEINK
jgi:hypothetical protein